MVTKNISGAEKASVLLLYLGEEVASKVFRNLKEDEIHMLGKHMTHLQHITSEQVDSVIDEFSGLMSSDTIFSLGGEDYVRNVLLKALGEDKAQSVLRLLSMPMVGGFDDPGSKKEISVVDALRKMDAEAIANLIRGEHPQTIALILSHLEPQHVSKVIPLLTEELQAEVVIRVGTLGRVPPGAMEEIEEVLKTHIKKVSVGENLNIGGLEPVAEMMNMIDRTAGDAIMAAIEEKSPELADEIKNLMFVFDDLTLLDDRSMQMVLKEVSNEDLTVALKTANDGVKDQVFKNVSERAAGMIKEDLEAMGPVRVKDVENAQQAIASIVRRLEGEGKVFISGRGGDEVID